MWRHLCSVAFIYYTVGSRSEAVFKVLRGTAVLFYSMYFNYIEVLMNILATSAAFSTCLLAYTFKRGLKSESGSAVSPKCVSLFQYINSACVWYLF